MSYSMEPVAMVVSDLRDLQDAPRQGHEGAPDAWIDIDPRFEQAAADIEPGDELVLISWLHAADRATQSVHPRSDPRNPMTGVFSTRSPDRPNPLGLHRVTVKERDGLRVRVGPLELIDGTPIVDIKVALD